jgi:hypothetical protein
MKKLICVIILSSFCFISCKSFQKGNENKCKGKNKNETTSSSDIPTKTDTNIYRISVSFFSVGGGIDNKAKLIYDKFVQEFEQQKGLKLSFEIANWGKEGETDYCFTLSELNYKDQEQFTIESKNILLDFKTVSIKENTSCEHKK